MRTIVKCLFAMFSIQNEEIRPMFIVVREYWTWATGYETCLVIIDVTGDIHKIICKCCVPINITTYKELITHLTGLHSTQIIRHSVPIKCADFDELTKYLTGINSYSTGINPVAGCDDRLCLDFVNETRLGCATSMIFANVDNNVLLIEKHCCEYHTVTNENINKLTKHLYKIAGMSNTF